MPSRTKTGAPGVSVIVAAYNRSNVLRYALRSALAQNFSDIEILVIGDACTDDTEDVVCSFNDSRLSYIDLPLNFGEQSGPNNVGIARAQGRYIAFLNQDDFWFPDHLATAVEWLEATGAQIVTTFTALFEGNDPNSWKAGLNPPSKTSFFDPFRDFAPATSWLVRAEVFALIGLFRPAAELRCEPTQEFLFRAWRAGVVHRVVPHLTAIGLPSGTRKNSYLNRDSSEHDLLASLLFDQPNFRNELLSRLGPTPERSFSSRVRNAIGIALMRPLALAGVSPRSAHMVTRAGVSKGGLISSLRRIRGLDQLNYSPNGRDPLATLRSKEIARGPAYSIGERVSFAAGQGLGIKEAGWSRAESGGTWTDGSEAAVVFRLKRDHKPSPFILFIDAVPFTGKGFVYKQRVELAAGETVLGRLSLSADSRDRMSVVIPPEFQLPGRLLRISLRLPDAISPKRLGISTDVRRLGIFVCSMELSYARGFLWRAPPCVDESTGA